MNRTFAILGALAAVGLGACAEGPGATEETPASGPQVLGVGPSGLPNFITGALARAPVPASWTRPELDLAPALREVTPLFGLSPAELELRRSWTDELGYGHARFARVVRGLPVVGTELLVHVDAEGLVYAANGEGFAGIDLDPVPAVSEAAARGTALAAPGERRVLESRLVWLVPQLSGVALLAWEVRTAGTGEGGEIVAERVYVDAQDGQVADRRSLVYRAKYRRVYDYPTSALRRSEGQAATGNSIVDAAYDKTGVIHDCFSSLFGRDSYDGSGGSIDTVVNYSDEYGPNNAFWDGNSNLMYFGKGDNSEFYNFALGFDVIAHEFSHGVDQYTANLAYQYESGALNEAYSDILSAVCEAYADGGVTSADTWKIGEDVYSPGYAGDALRYMNNPTADGISYDYWPERYLTEGSPDDNNDMGGVHTNSGIPNLAYYLSVVGGRHPRNKTTVNVSGIGMAAARGPFFRALTTYLTSGSSFQSARLATYQAALDQGGASVAAAIDSAWAAVGVPPTWLQNGVAVTPLTGNNLTKLYFRLEVPAGSTNLRVATTGGSGGCNLYLKQGSAPTTSSYFDASTNTGTAELVEAAAPAAGTWYVLLNGVSPFTGVRLLASWEAHNLTAPEKPSLPPEAPTP